MKQKGFTLIELLIGIVILAIIGLVAVGSSGDRNSKLSIGINGLTEVRCIDGYKFVIGEHGQARQVLDEFGKGAKCN